MHVEESRGLLMVRNIVFYVCALTLAGCGQRSAPAPVAPPAAAAAPAALPAPARSQQYKDGYQKGVSLAQAELKQGKLALLGYGLPPDWNFDIHFSEFGKFGIVYDVYGNGLDDNLEGYVIGYNEVMAKAVSEKHGANTIATIQARIKQRLESEKPKQ